MAVAQNKSPGLYLKFCAGDSLNVSPGIGRLYKLSRLLGLSRLEELMISGNWNGGTVEYWAA